MKTKTCTVCNEEKSLSEFHTYRGTHERKPSSDHDGYRPVCIACNRIREAGNRAKNKRARESGLAKALIGVPGIDNLPCTGCMHFNRCRDTAVDCPSFRNWTLNGRKNSYERLPDRYLIGGEFAIEL